MKWSPKAEREMIANVTEAPRLRRRRFLPAALGFILMVLGPTAAAYYYYYEIAVDRYVSEFRYSVRGGAMMQAGAESGGSIGGAGALVFAADSFVLEDYLASVQAFEDIERRLPLRQMLAKDGGDPVRRFDGAAPAEDLVGFWESAVNVRFDAVTGISTATISFFTPEDALAVSEALIAELQILVNNLSKEQRDEMLRYVNEQHRIAEDELNQTRDRIETFRRENRIASPEEQVRIESDILGALSSQLAAKRVEMRTLLQRAPNSPMVPSVAEEIASLEAQLLAQYEARGGESQEMATLLAQYEELQEDYELARLNYVETNNLKQQAEANATLNQAQLVVFVKPRLPVQSIEPDRPLEVLIFFVYAFLIWLVLRIFLASLPTQ